MLIREWKWVAWAFSPRHGWGACGSSDDKAELARRLPGAIILPAGKTPR